MRYDWAAGAALAASLGFAAQVAAAAGPLAGENLLAPTAAGFVLSESATQRSVSMMEYVPRGETVDSWSRMITVLIYKGYRRVDGDVWLAETGKRWIASCEKGGAQKVKSGVENGFPFTLWAMSCPLNPRTGKPENTYFKAISGDESFYMAQYAVREPFSPEQAPPMIGYLRQVIACDTRRKGRSCPVDD